MFSYHLLALFCPTIDLGINECLILLTAAMAMTDRAFGHMINHTKLIPGLLDFL